VCGISQVWPVFLHSLGITDEAGDESGREGEDLLLDAVAVKGDGPDHDAL
jgi:hypothetical protein